MQARAPIENGKKLRPLNEWSTPERRVGTRELPLIPNEIYLDIINYFHPLDELGPGECRVVWRSLGLACRFFYSVTFPRLFSSIIFSPSQVSRSQPDTFSFLRKLKFEEEPALSLSPHVKECFIRDWNDFSESKHKWTNNFFTLFLKVVVKMENLTSLNLDRTPISLKLLKTIGKLQQLRSLKLDTCTTATVDARNFECLSSLNLTSFHLFRCAIPLWMFVPLMPHLKELRTDGWAALRLLADQDSLCLRVLEIHDVRDIPVLSSVLAKTPMLSELHLGLSQAEKLEHFAPIPIPASSIRNLRRLCCDPRHLQYFSCSNLLEVVHLTSTAVPFLQPIQFNMSPHVRALHLRGYLFSRDVALSVSAFFPNVEQLTIIINHKTEVLIFGLPGQSEEFSERVCSLLKARNVPTRTLRKLVIDVKGAETLYLFKDVCFNLPFQRQMITNLEQHGFTNLVGVSFMCVTSWRRLGSGDWEPFVHYEHRKTVKFMLVHSNFQVVDPYGCLASVPQSEAE